jgi:hypothetical protein
MPLPKRLKPETPGSKRQSDGHCRAFTEFTLQFNFGARQVRRHAAFLRWRIFRREIGVDLGSLGGIGGGSAGASPYRVRTRQDESKRRDIDSMVIKYVLSVMQAE